MENTFQRQAALITQVLKRKVLFLLVEINDHHAFGDMSQCRT